MARIAYLGPQGTFTEAAMLKLADAMPGGSDFEPVACDSSGAALEAVRTGAAEYACVPIENSIEGSVLPTMDSLSAGNAVQIFAEHTLDVSFSIVVRPGVTADAVATVAAFPVAAAQVRRWLAAHLPHATLVPAISNAGAAQDVSEGRADAGVSTAPAADRWGLSSLAEGVVDESNA
ncbi:MAG: prephenate dehydratase domain-containing protein, partial [Mycobacterium sp.]|nr:prephenate dehydratase domain-containing protein [Mycobacterium sp.]